MRNYHDYEIIEIEGETYHAYRQDIGTVILKKMGE